MTEYKPDGTYLQQEYAPAGSVNFVSRPIGSFAKMLSNGYIVRRDPAGNDPEEFVWLSGRGCQYVTKLNPLSIGDAISYCESKPVIVDRTAPSISIITPSDGINYGRYQKIPADWSASDGISGLKSATGTVSDGKYLDTMLPGIHVFNVQATDKAGNVGSLTYRYNVMDTPPSPQNGQGPPSLPETVPAPENEDDDTGTGPVSTPTPTPKPTSVPPSTPTVVPGPIGAVVQLGPTQIRAEIARSSEQINQGLMYRTSMAGDRGMLFVFSGDGMHSFHMQNTYIPLDMIFINKRSQDREHPCERTATQHELDIIRLALPLCPRGERRRLRGKRHPCRGYRGHQLGLSI